MVCKTVRNEAKRIKSIAHNSCQGSIMIPSKERPDGPLFFMVCAGVDLPPVSGNQHSWKVGPLMLFLKVKKGRSIMKVEYAVK